jgi:hypothetical protein
MQKHVDRPNQQNSICITFPTQSVRKSMVNQPKSCYPVDVLLKVIWTLLGLPQKYVIQEKSH